MKLAKHREKQRRGNMRSSALCACDCQQYMKIHHMSGSEALGLSASILLNDFMKAELNQSRCYKYYACVC